MGEDNPPIDSLGSPPTQWPLSRGCMWIFKESFHFLLDPLLARGSHQRGLTTSRHHYLQTPLWVGHPLGGPAAVWRPLYILWLYRPPFRPLGSCVGPLMGRKLDSIFFLYIQSQGCHTLHELAVLVRLLPDEATGEKQPQSLCSCLVP